MVIKQEKYTHCVPPGYPVIHRRKVPFTPRIVSPAGFARRASELRRLDAELDRFILRPNDYLELIIEAWSKNIHQSVHMEGNPLTLPEVERVTRDSLSGSRDTYDDQHRQEVLNHVIIQSDPRSWKAPWDMITMRVLHRFLMSGDPSANGGKFRTPAEDKDGRFGVWLKNKDQLLLRPAPAEHIEEELNALLEWRNTEAPVLFPVAAASVFFHEFESIHPFSDGNGRAGRVLFHAYLQSEGLRNSNLCLIEPELTKDIELYYRLLAWTDSSGSYTELVDYFTDALLQSYEAAVKRFSKKDLLSSELDEAEKRLIVCAKQRKRWFTVSEASSWVSSIGYMTLLKKLNHLVAEEVLEAKGKTRSRRYRFADPLGEFRATHLPEKAGATAEAVSGADNVPAASGEDGPPRESSGHSLATESTDAQSQA